MSRYKDLPKNTKRLLITGVLLALVAALPLFIWAVTTQKFLITQKAATGEALCPGVEACPYPQDPTLLRNCHPQDSDGTAQESLCNTSGRVEFCGTTNFCCPAPGQPWTTDMTACPTHSPFPTPTPATSCYGVPNGTACTLSICTAGYCPVGQPCSTPSCIYQPGVCSNGQCQPGSTPAPTCQPRPACLDGVPGPNGTIVRCLPPEPVGGWCPTPPPTPTPTPIPNSCGGTCGNNFNCQPGLFCNNGFCRNPACPSDLACGCDKSKSFGILFKFDGVSDDSANGAKVTVKFSNPGWYGASYITSPITASHVANGVYSLRFSLPASYLPFYSQYSIVLKGEKHAQMKFCQPQGQTIYCTAATIGQIYIPNTSSIISFNFTGIPLPAGDTITQDGRVNDVDYARIFAILSKPSSSQTAQDLQVGDLNYNGRVDGVDMFLLMKTLGTRYDEN